MSRKSFNRWIANKNKKNKECHTHLIQLSVFFTIFDDIIQLIRKSFVKSLSCEREQGNPLCHLNNFSGNLIKQMKAFVSLLSSSMLTALNPSRNWDENSSRASLKCSFEHERKNEMKTLKKKLISENFVVILSLTHSKTLSIRRLQREISIESKWEKDFLTTWWNERKIAHYGN